MRRRLVVVAAVLALIAFACAPRPAENEIAASAERGHESAALLAEAPAPNTTPPAPAPEKRKPASRPRDDMTKSPPRTCASIDQRIEIARRVAPDVSEKGDRLTGDRASEFLAHFNAVSPFKYDADEIAIVESTEWGPARYLVLFELKGCPSGVAAVDLRMPGDFDKGDSAP